MGIAASVPRITYDDAGDEVMKLHYSLLTLPAHEKKRVLDHFHKCVEDFYKAPLCYNAFYDLYDCCRRTHMTRIVKMLEHMLHHTTGDIESYCNKIVLICRIRSRLLYEMSGIRSSNITCHNTQLARSPSKRNLTKKS